MSLSTNQLITMLRDGLQESADCIDCALGSISVAGRSTADAQRQVDASLAMVKEADSYLSAQPRLNSADYLNQLTAIRSCIRVLQKARLDAFANDADLAQRAPILFERVNSQPTPTRCNFTMGIQLLQQAEIDLKKDLKELGRTA
ncbi:hypothetical protein L4C36_22720 [Photobacterium japonica]|uniref:hypothetical protein n=1 Tax=Photobacterium japonica TaxID=2910235 RepID=UPI003D0D854D